MMLQKKHKKKKIIGYLLFFFLLTTFNNLYFIKSNKFNLTNIFVNGLDEKINLKILQDLKIITLENIFFLDKDFLKNEMKVSPKSTFKDNMIDDSMNKLAE